MRAKNFDGGGLRWERVGVLLAATADGWTATVRPRKLNGGKITVHVEVYDCGGELATAHCIHQTTPDTTAEDSLVQLGCQYAARFIGQANLNNLQPIAFDTFDARELFGDVINSMWKTCENSGDTASLTLSFDKDGAWIFYNQRPAHRPEAGIRECISAAELRYTRIPVAAFVAMYVERAQGKVLKVLEGGA